MTSPIRLTAVLTHPVQYYAPWFRYVATNCPQIDLTVVYATQPTPEQQGTGFGTAFAWDVPLLEGYRNIVVRPPRPGDDVGGPFKGLDVPEIGDAILETKPDVVLVPGWSSITLVRAIRTCRRAGIPLIYRGDSILATPHRGWRKLARSLRARYFLRQYAAYLSVGTRSREYLTRHGAATTRIYASPHCVDNGYFADSSAPHQAAGTRRAARAAWRLPEDSFVALFAGKLEEKKRPIDLIQAAARLDGRVSLLVVGTGAMLDECRHAAESLGVKVAWAGFLNQSEIGKAYVAADGLVLPSDSRETWGLVVNEAMATGLPCVVSDAVGCAPDMLTPGETGETYPVGDVAALAAALDRVRRMSQDGHGWAAACRERAKRHSFEAATVGLLAACEAVASARPSTRTTGDDCGEDAVPRCDSARVLTTSGGMVVVFGLERMTFEALRAVRSGGGVVHCMVNERENHRIVALAEQIGASWSVGHYWYLVRKTRNPFKLLGMALRVGRTSFELLREAYRFRPTHVLLPEHGSIVRNWPALIILRALRTKTIFRVGNAFPPEKFYYRLLRWIVNPAVGHYVCVSKFVAQSLQQHGIAERKTTVIYNTLHADRQSDQESQCETPIPGRLVYVGQIIPQKNVRLLVDAVALLRERGTDVSLDIVGPYKTWTHENYRQYRAEFLERVDQEDLKHSIRLLGPRNDVVRLMQRADLHVAPSSLEMGEGCPNVVLEAKAAGIPSVAFRLGPYPELIEHRVNGWLCDIESAESLADGIEAMLRDSDRMHKARHAAKESLAQFSSQHFIRRWRRLLGGGSNPSTHDGNTKVVEVEVRQQGLVNCQKQRQETIRVRQVSQEMQFEHRH